MSQPKWIVVMSPRGDVVVLDDEFSDCKPEALYIMVTTGVMDERVTPGATPVVVNGRYISLIWRDDVRAA